MVRKVSKLTAAETGHLVFGTLHTTTAASTIDRIIDQFPADRQSQVLVMLSESLRAVITQILCRKIGCTRGATREEIAEALGVAVAVNAGAALIFSSRVMDAVAEGSAA